ncbi:UNVERIFIED_CONTAM: hypothetical protein Slati_2255100 [Sesamum latifolium]|uniref:Uncharacterized protein n=1 Tax=Sesamum latifolium TaxID=2727402 RepID=A0AAW2WTF8_9LAMI
MDKAGRELAGRELAGRELSSPRGHQVASHELAGCELTRSLACSSQVAGSPGPGRWLVARKSLARQDQVAGHQVARD